MTAIQFPLGLAGSDPFFTFKLGWWDIPAVLGIGIGGTSSHYCLSNAFRAGDATARCATRLPARSGDRICWLGILCRIARYLGVCWRLCDHGRTILESASGSQQPRACSEYLKAASMGAATTDGISGISGAFLLRHNRTFDLQRLETKCPPSTGSTAPVINAPPSPANSISGSTKSSRRTSLRIGIRRIKA